MSIFSEETFERQRFRAAVGRWRRRRAAQRRHDALVALAAQELLALARQRSC
jgi:hypothetical protein